MKPKNIRNLLPLLLAICMILTSGPMTQTVEAKKAYKQPYVKKTFVMTIGQTKRLKIKGIKAKQVKKTYRKILSEKSRQDHQEKDSSCSAGEKSW